jgi:hypothetical protein
MRIGPAGAAKACEPEARAVEAYVDRNRAPCDKLSYGNTKTVCQNRILSCRLDTSPCESLGEQCFQRCGGSPGDGRVCSANCG